MNVRHLAFAVGCSTLVEYWLSCYGKPYYLIGVE
jgi:hypothetical protein